MFDASPYTIFLEVAFDLRLFFVVFPACWAFASFLLLLLCIYVAAVAHSVCFLLKSAGSFCGVAHLRVNSKREAITQVANQLLLCGKRACCKISSYVAAQSAILFGELLCDFCPGHYFSVVGCLIQLIVGELLVSVSGPSSHSH